MLQNIMRTKDSTTLTVLRLALGVMIFAHGAQKALGIWGGFGITGTMGFFASLGIPALFGYMAIAAEFLGGACLILGVFGRVAAAAVVIDMIAAVLIVHRTAGFFMNWNMAAMQNEGFEFHLLAVAIGIAVMIEGSGSMSVDQAVGGKA